MELSEAAAEAAQRASTAAAMATIQAKAALATVKLVIDLEAQKVQALSEKGDKDASTSTEEPALIEISTEAKESVILRVKHEDETYEKQGDYIRYTRDLLLRLQYHPVASHRPTGIADAEVVRKSLNREALHSFPQRMQQPENYVKLRNPETLKNERLDITFRHIRRNISEGMPTSRSQVMGVLMLIKEYAMLFPIIQDHIARVQQFAYLSAVQNMEVIHRPMINQLQSDDVATVSPGSAPMHMKFHSQKESVCQT